MRVNNFCSGIIFLFFYPGLYLIIGFNGQVFLWLLFIVFPKKQQIKNLVKLIVKIIQL